MLRHPVLLSLDVDNTTLKMPADQANPVPYLNGDLLLKLIEFVVLSDGRVILNTNRSPALDADTQSNGGFTCEELKNDLERRLNIEERNLISVCLRTPEVVTALGTHNDANPGSQILSTKAFAIHTALTNNPELTVAVHIDDEQPVVDQLVGWRNPRLSVFKVPNPQDAHGNIEYLQQLAHALGIEELLLNYQLFNEHKKIQLAQADELQEQTRRYADNLAALVADYQRKRALQTRLQATPADAAPGQLETLDKEIVALNKKAEGLAAHIESLAKAVLILAETTRIPALAEPIEQLRNLLSQAPSAANPFTALQEARISSSIALANSIRDHLNSRQFQADQLGITTEQFDCLRSIYGLLLTYNRGEIPPNITPVIQIPGQEVILIPVLLDANAAPQPAAANADEDESEHLEASGPDHLISDLTFSDTDFYSRDAHGKPLYFSSVLIDALRAVNDKGLGRSFSNPLVRQDLIVSQIIPTGANSAGATYRVSSQGEIIAALNRLHDYYRNGNSSQRPVVHKNPAKAGIFLALMATHPSLSLEQNAQAFKRLGEHYLARYRGAPGYKKEKKDFLIEHALTYLLMALQIAPINSALKTDQSLADNIALAFKTWCAKKPKREQQTRQLVITTLLDILKRQEIDPASNNPLANLLKALQAGSKQKADQENYLVTLLQEATGARGSNLSEVISNAYGSGRTGKVSNALATRFGKNQLMELLWKRLVLDPTDVSILLDLAYEYEIGVHLQNGTANTAFAIALYQHLLQIKVDERTEPLQHECQLKAKERLYTLIRENQESQAIAYLIELALSGNETYSTPALQKLAVANNTGEQASRLWGASFHREGTTITAVDFDNPKHHRELFALADLYNQQGNCLYAKIIWSALRDKLKPLAFIDEPAQEYATTASERVNRSVDRHMYDILSRDEEDVGSHSSSESDRSATSTTSSNLSSHDDDDVNIAAKRHQEATLKLAKLYIVGGNGVGQRPDLALTLLLELADGANDLDVIEKQQIIRLLMVLFKYNPNSNPDQEDDSAYLFSQRFSPEILDAIKTIKFHGIDDNRNVVTAKDDFESILHIPKFQQILQELRAELDYMDELALIFYFDLAQNLANIKAGDPAYLNHDELSALAHIIKRGEDNRGRFLLNRKETAFIKIAFALINQLGMAQEQLCREVSVVDGRNTLQTTLAQTWFAMLHTRDEIELTQYPLHDELRHRMARAQLGEDVEQIGLKRHHLIAEIDLALKIYFDSINKVSGHTHKDTLLDFLEKQVVILIKRYEAEIEKRIRDNRDPLIEPTVHDRELMYQHLNNALIEIKHIYAMFCIETNLLRKILAVDAKTQPVAEVDFDSSTFGLRRRGMRVVKPVVTITNAELEIQNGEREDFYRDMLENLRAMLNAHTKGENKVLRESELIQQKTERQAIRQRFIEERVVYYTANVASIANADERAEKRVLFLATLDFSVRKEIEDRIGVIPVAASVPLPLASERVEVVQRGDLNDVELGYPRGSQVLAINDDPVVVDDSEPLLLSLDSRRSSGYGSITGSQAGEPQLLRTGGRRLESPTTVAPAAVNIASGVAPDQPQQTPEAARAQAAFLTIAFVILAYQAALSNLELPTIPASQKTTDALKNSQLSLELDRELEKALKAYLDQNPGATEIGLCTREKGLKKYAGHVDVYTREEILDLIKKGELRHRGWFGEFVDNRGNFFRFTFHGLNTALIAGGAWALNAFTGKVASTTLGTYNASNMPNVTYYMDHQFGPITGPMLINYAESLNINLVNTQRTSDTLDAHKEALEIRYLLLMILMGAILAHGCFSLLNWLLRKPDAITSPLNKTPDPKTLKSKNGEIWHVRKQAGLCCEPTASYDWMIDTRVLFKNVKPEVGSGLAVTASSYHGPYSLRIEDLLAPQYATLISAPPVSVAMRAAQDTLDSLLAKLATVEEHIRNMPNGTTRTALLAKCRAIGQFLIEEFSGIASGNAIMLPALDSDSSTSSTLASRSRSGSNPDLFPLTPSQDTPQASRSRSGSDSSSNSRHGLDLTAAQRTATIDHPPRPSVATHSAVPQLHRAEVHVAPSSPPTVAISTATVTAVTIGTLADPSAATSHPAVPVPAHKQPPAKAPKPVAAPAAKDAEPVDPGTRFGIKLKKGRDLQPIATQGNAPGHQLHRGGKDWRDQRELTELEIRLIRVRERLDDRTEAGHLDGKSTTVDAYGKPIQSQRAKALAAAPARRQAKAEEARPVGLFRGYGNDANARRQLGEYIQATCPDYAVGRAIDTGDCFFDAFAQGLTQLQILQDNLQDNRSPHNAKSLRTICHEYAQRLHGSHGMRAGNPIYDHFHARAMQEFNAIKGPQKSGLVARRAEANYTKYLNFIRFTKADIDSGAAKTIDAKKETCEWGDSSLDGDILCKALKVNLNVIEIPPPSSDSAAIPLVHTQTMINPEGNIQHADRVLTQEQFRNVRTVHLINTTNHFVPLLPSDFLQRSDLGALTSRECVLDLTGFDEGAQSPRTQRATGAGTNPRAMFSLPSSADGKREKERAYVADVADTGAGVRGLNYNSGSE